LICDLADIFRLDPKEKTEIDVDVIAELMQNDPVKVLKKWIDKVKDKDTRKVLYAVYIIARLEGASLSEDLLHAYDYIRAIIRAGGKERAKQILYEDYMQYRKSCYTNSAEVV